MHKEAKNDKVLRAITIGIAAMMATASMPTTVLANENPEGQNPTPEEAPEDRFVEDKTEAEANEETAKAEITEIRDDADDLADDSAAATDLIDAALVDANVIGDQEIIDDLIRARNDQNSSLFPVFSFASAKFRREKETVPNASYSSQSRVIVPGRILKMISARERLESKKTFFPVFFMLPQMPSSSV